MSSPSPSPADHLAILRPLSFEFPNIDSATAEIARLAAVLTLPKGTIHIISDIHGEDKKLRHIINNASGTLRPLIEHLFAANTPAEELQEFLTLSFYPAEVTAHLEQTLTDAGQLRAFARRTLRRQFILVRTLAARYSLKRAMAVFPPEYSALLSEMLFAPTTERGDAFEEAIIDELQGRGDVLHLIHLTGRLVRNLAVAELVIGGDLWDRGPRGDRVVEYLRQQPNVRFVYGNHDASWLGAALGHEALICNVLRISLRYRRLAQIDEGYSIPLTPLEHLARTVYGDDPAEFFMPAEEGMRPMEVIARMQKAAAIMQFKLEGQMIARNPHWNLDHRRLLHHIDLKKGTIAIDGVEFELRDKRFPTLDPRDPYALSPEEQACMARLQHSFLNSQKLWEHMKHVVAHGCMYLLRDDHLVFHGCVPCDADGNFLPLEIDGTPLSGKPMFDAINTAVLRALEEKRPADLDLLWYLWSGPLSPLFGKDKIATLERDFIIDKQSHEEHKDPYFALINTVDFCDKVLREFGVDTARGLIVNGHVPVKIEKGESPLKKSGKAITIDGAFSEAYGDHGYTLVLEAGRTLLACHHHFESVEAALQSNTDIIPTVTLIREEPPGAPPRKVADTERGAELRARITFLESLIDAYRRNLLPQHPSSPPHRI
jgi:fructose-1,6-bisphosphatase-3